MNKVKTAKYTPQYPDLNPYNWVNEHGDYLYAYASSRIDDDEQARDLVQETFLAALEGQHKFEGRCSERTWLTSIIKYKIIDLYRKKSGIASSSESSVTYLEDAFFEEEDGHWKKDAQPQEFGIEDRNAMENKEFHRILMQCMQKLPALWMSIFKLKFLDEECADTICNHLKLSASNYWVIIHRTKVNLRSCLQKNWG